MKRVFFLLIFYICCLGAFELETSVLHWSALICGVSIFIVSVVGTFIIIRTVDE